MFKLDRPRVRTLYMCLSSYIFRFSSRLDLDLDIEKGFDVCLNSKQTVLLCGYFERAFRDFSADCYKEPRQKDIQRRSSSFERLLVDGRKYIVDYRLSLDGWILWAIYSYWKKIENACNEEAGVRFIFESL